MTNSYLAVGISGAVELIPLIIFGLHSGFLDWPTQRGLFEK
ncbi:MAG: hypothetical protein Q8K86_01435 [Candidatus Nanopelagicaceae bacterium]|nr:hypothetical protein [Candidatus Nanopelagicaceae bacterium]